MTEFRYAFAGDRDIAVEVLRYLLSLGHRPAALLLTEPGRASHADELAALCPELDESRVLIGDAFREPRGLALLRELELDVVAGIHFPYLVPGEVLALPRMGVLNLHPAYLPYNRGWHTPSWALLEDTPVGATLHFMDEGVDTGDVVHQRELRVLPGDTADSLYRRLKALELEVFREAWPHIVAGRARRVPQRADGPRARRRTELMRPEVQRIGLDETVRAGSLLRRLRALTTSRVDEAAYYEVDGIRYRVQVSIHPEPAPGADGEGRPAAHPGNGASVVDS